MMLNKQTNCSKKLNEYLGELARREDLELLRAPLRDNELFPPDKDPATAGITHEELKKLVRHWKLHEARGFWKIHPTKEDLVYALLEYMEDKDDYTKKGPQRPISSKPSKEAPKRPARHNASQNVDLATFKVTVLKPYAGDLFSQQDHTMGLIYLSRQNLRNNPAATAKAGSPVKASPRTNRTTGFLSGEFFPPMSPTDKTGAPTTSVNSVMESSPEENEATERQRERWLAIITEIFRYSVVQGDEKSILDEGALQVVEMIAKTEVATSSLANSAMAGCCAATLANLAVEPSCHGRLLPPHTPIVVEALNGVATHHALDARVMSPCLLALCFLSCSRKDVILNSCLSTLTSGVGSDSLQCRRLSVAALTNLLNVSENRNQLVEHLVPALKLMAPDDDEEEPREQEADEAISLLLVLCATYNLSLFDFPRVVLTESGGVAMLGKILDALVKSNVLLNLEAPVKNYTEHMLDVVEGVLRHAGDAAVLVAVDAIVGAPPAAATAAIQREVPFSFDREAVLHTLAQCYLNMSINDAENRGRMINDGAVSALVVLEKLAKKRTTRGIVALALSNMTGDLSEDFALRVLDEGIVPTVVKLTSDEHLTAEVQSRLAATLCNLSIVKSRIAQMIGEKAHLALMTLASKKQNEETTSLVLIACINLLTLPAAQVEIVEGGLLLLLERLCSSKDKLTPEIERLCGSTLANIADDLGLHSQKTHVVVLGLMTTLAKTKTGGVELLRIVANAFAFFAHIITNNDDDDCDTALLLTKEVVETIVGLCDCKDSMVLKFAGVALNNLSQKESFHEILVTNGVVRACLGLAQSRDDEARRYCASTVRSLTSAAGFKQLASMEVVDSLVAVLRSLESARAPDINNSSAAALFAISCASGDALLQRDKSILWRLFGMMRGGEESTQLYAARALCNLTSHESTVITLQRERAIADFIAIAILRTNNEDVKGVCAECLFNMLRYEKSRPALLKEPNNVLWAISRLFRSVESSQYCSQRTQRIGGLVLYNLSCTPKTAAVLMETINAAETLASVAATPGVEPTIWAAAALSNLSANPDFAARLVKDAGHAHRAPPPAQNGGAPVQVQHDTEPVGRGIVRIVHCLLETTMPRISRLEATASSRNAAVIRRQASMSGSTVKKQQQTIEADDGDDANVLEKASDRSLVRVLCAKTLYNLSRVSPEISEVLVDDGIIILLELILESAEGDTVLIELALLVLYNLSSVPSCEVAVVDFQAAGCMVKLLKRILPAKALKAAEIATAPSKKKRPPPTHEDDDEHYESEEETYEEEEEVVVEDDGEDLSTFPVCADQTASSIVTLVLATLSNLSNKQENRGALQAAGVGDVCVAVAATSIEGPVQMVALKVLRNLSALSEAHRANSSRRKTRPLIAALSRWSREFQDSKEALFDACSVVANLSCTALLVDALVAHGVVPLIAKLARLCVADETALGVLALATRNLSPSAAKIARKKDSLIDEAWLGQECVDLLSTLSHYDGPTLRSEDEAGRERLEDAAAALYNLLTTGGAALLLADDLSTILTSLFKKCDKNPITRSLCAAALIERQSSQEKRKNEEEELLLLLQDEIPTAPPQSAEKQTHYSDGSVVALHSAMMSEVAQLDAATVAAPRKLKAKRSFEPKMLDAKQQGLEAFFVVKEQSKASWNWVGFSSNELLNVEPAPEWVRFEQDATAQFSDKSLEAPPTASVKLPKQPAEPPKAIHSKTSGVFKKVKLTPNKVTTTQTRRRHGNASPTASQGSVHSDDLDIPVVSTQLELLNNEDTQSLITQDGPAFQINLKFDMASFFKPLQGAD